MKKEKGLSLPPSLFFTSNKALAQPSGLNSAVYCDRRQLGARYPYHDVIPGVLTDVVVPGVATEELAEYELICIQLYR